VPAYFPSADLSPVRAWEPQTALVAFLESL
jgi:hypothetical protein